MIVIKSIPHDDMIQIELFHKMRFCTDRVWGRRDWMDGGSGILWEERWLSGGVGVGRFSVDGCKLDPRVPDTRKAATRTIVLWLNDGTDGDELERVSKVRIPSVLHKALFGTPICMHSGYKATFFIQGLSKGWFTRIERFERIETRKDKIQKQLWL